MKTTWKKVGIIILCIGTIMESTACGNHLSNQVPTESVSTEHGDGTMLYTDEELGISFRISQELYNTLICEISPQETDLQTNQEKIVASFYGEIEETRVPLFHISIYEGGFDENYLKEKAPNMHYLGTQRGFTYTMEYEDIEPFLEQEKSEKNTLMLKEEIEELHGIEEKINVTGVAQGIFLDEKAGKGIQPTQIDYAKETVTQETEEIETVVATVTSQLGYQIQFQSDYFTYSEEENKEIYLAKNQEGDFYPNIYLSITKVEGTTREDVVASLRESAPGSSKKNIQIGKKDALYMTTRIRSEEGTDANSIVTESYVLENENNIYLITSSYFKEAEGIYCEKLQQMLDTFYLV